MFDAAKMKESIESFDPKKDIHQGPISARSQRKQIFHPAHNQGSGQEEMFSSEGQTFEEGTFDSINDLTAEEGKHTSFDDKMQAHGKNSSFQQVMANSSYLDQMVSKQN